MLRLETDPRVLRNRLWSREPSAPANPSIFPRGIRAEKTPDSVTIRKSDVVGAQGLMRDSNRHECRLETGPLPARYVDTARKQLTRICREFRRDRQPGAPNRSDPPSSTDLPSPPASRAGSTFPACPCPQIGRRAAGGRRLGSPVCRGLVRPHFAIPTAPQLPPAFAKSREADFRLAGRDAKKNIT
jgi:hypothetical protein